MGNKDDNQEKVMATVKLRDKKLDLSNAYPAEGKAAAKPKKKRAPRAPDKKILAEKEKEEGKRGATGRPTKLTTKVLEDICNAIRGGSYMETAAAYAGISKDTLYEWLRKGARDEGEEFRQFSDAVKKALADSEVQGIARLRNHGKDTWQADAWFLERRFKCRWGKSIQVNNDLENMSNEELLLILEEG